MSVSTACLVGEKKVGREKETLVLIYEEIRGVLKIFLQNEICDAVTYTEHARRKTLTAMDVVYQGRTLYSFGVPLEIDESTKIRTFGHYARILIDLDLSQPILNNLLVGREESAFFVKIEYEKQPLFCNNCKHIRHSIQNCKKIAQNSIDLFKENKENTVTKSHHYGKSNVRFKHIDRPSETDNLAGSLKTKLNMIHDTHLDNRIDVIKGRAKLAEQSGAMIGSAKQSKESDVGRTENLTCNNHEVHNVVQELDTVNSDAGASVEVKHMSKSKKQKTKQKKHKAKNIEWW
uniref:Histone H4 n=1 Tax=Medicago truncatula TaxID=3880 RepID=A2Q2T8_MEDTR|nr:Histone H4; Histone-fold [Medicago truncatula]